MPDMAVEVAIRTFRHAERPVHIDAERAGASIPIASERRILI
jgi:hypothetical protein